MGAQKDVIRRILAGERPEGIDLCGLAVDGKGLPARDRVVPWDLSGTNLRGAVLTRLDLTGSSFEGADLSGAVFRNVSLARTDFRRASASGAVFEDVNLSYATFRDADLRGASLSYANLADICFKNADMRGASVNAVRFSLNGKTHTLGLKEALIHRYRDVSYPFAVGVSGDAFWLSYLPESGELAWGGYAKETLTRGLRACGFESEFVNELDVEEAWRGLTRQLKPGGGVITPLHVGGRHITGSGFGGSDWVYVSAYDPAQNAVTVRCMLGDDLVFPWDEFIRSWCIHHPLTPQRGRIVYTYCVVGDRTEDVEPARAVLRGIEEGLQILSIGEHPDEHLVCGLAVYDLLLRDLDLDPQAGEGCAWLGLGLMHHHGSRWAIRDFLAEARGLLGAGHLGGVERALALYEEVVKELASALRLLPDSLDGPDAVGTFLEVRDRAAAHLRRARAQEEEAREALESLVGG